MNNRLFIAKGFCTLLCLIEIINQFAFNAVLLLNPARKTCPICWTGFCGLPSYSPILWLEVEHTEATSSCPVSQVLVWKKALARWGLPLVPLCRPGSACGCCQLSLAGWVGLYPTKDCEHKNVWRMKVGQCWGKDTVSCGGGGLRQAVGSTWGTWRHAIGAAWRAAGAWGHRRSWSEMREMRRYLCFGKVSLQQKPEAKRGSWTAREPVSGAPGASRAGSLGFMSCEAVFTHVSKVQIR